MRDDTIRLLGDCTAGIDMALSTIDGLLPDVKDLTLRSKLRQSKQDHQQLRRQSIHLLHQYGAQEKLPSPMVKTMAWLKTNTRMAIRGDDTTAAYLVADGCDMGVKALSRSRNRNCTASQSAVDLAQALIRCEEDLSAGLRPFL